MNKIIICSKSYKNELLKNVKELNNDRYYTLDEFIKLLYFNYDEKAIIYLMNKYDIKYEIAKEYLDNLIYIEDKVYNNKLDKLVSIKKELDDNKLLIYDNLFKELIKDKEIEIINYDLNKFYKYLLKDINYKVIDNKINKYIPKIYEASTMEEEISFVAKEICKLIDNNISVNKIKLTNVKDDYLNYINKIFKFYNLKINKSNNSPLYSSYIGNIFYNSLESGIDGALNNIDNYKESDIYNKIISIINKYVWANDKDKITLIKHDLESINIKEDKYTNSIEVVDYNEYLFKDEYVFMLNFNEGVIPITYKDVDYITDNLKPNYMMNTLELNNYSKDITLKSIYNIKNLVITYKLKDDFNSYYSSNLIDDLGVDIIKIRDEYKVSYSDLFYKLYLSKRIDELIKYDVKSDELNLLYSNYNIPYNTYDHSFNGINKNIIRDFIKNKDKFNLSYSTMDNYNRCAFKFYIEKILELNDFTVKFSTILGNICHYVLERCLKKEEDIKLIVDEYIHKNNINLSISEEFFLNKNMDTLKSIIDIIKKQNSYSKLNKMDTEKYIDILIKDNIHFVGFIDKIVYDNINGINIGSIIDYKTYVKKPTLKYIDYGIDLQLPTYMYLASNVYKDIKFAGFYLQNIDLSNNSIEDKEKNLKLIGYTNKDETIISAFDSSYKCSEVISGLKVTSSGEFSSSSLNRMMSDEEINDIINITKDKINETIDNIENAKFDINPKYSNGNIGCEFCKYKDLCFMKEYDLVNIKPKNTSEGDDINGMD